MVKLTETICRQNMFDHFVGFAFKGLNTFSIAVLIELVSDRAGLVQAQIN